MIVYRVEHRDTTQGPYNPGRIADRDRRVLRDVNDKFGIRNYAAPKHQPAPWQDGIEFRDGDHYSAFASLDDLLAWFGEGFAEAVSEAGFSVVRYYARLRDVQIGRRQVAFIRDNARRLGAVPASPTLPLRKAYT